MSKQWQESLSALVDDEADDLELRRILSQQSPEQVNDLWSRYHRVKSLMNDEAETKFTQLDISSQVSALVVDEPAHRSAQSSNANWWRPVASFAVAASVAVAVVVGVQYSTPNGASVSPAATVASSRVYPAAINGAVGNVTASAQVNTAAALPSGSQLASTEDAEKRLEKYMLRHTQRAALNNNQGMMSFARVASFETE